MSILLTILAIICFLSGIIGCVIPLIPGPPLSYLGLLLIHFTRFAEFSTTFLLVMALITIAVTLADIYLPVWFTKKYGGSRAASVGAVLGIFAGLFVFPPLGIIICPFLGAFVGELLHNSTDHGRALKVAAGSFIAFMAGTGLKLIASGVMLFYGISSLFG